MYKLLATLVHDYRWIHLGIGVLGNLTFVIGSVFFLPSFSDYETLGVYLFIGGSLLMFMGALGEFFVRSPLVPLPSDKDDG